MKIGDKIRNAREDLDMSQTEISNLIPMNQSNYSKIERNIQEPNLEQLRQICIILHLDPNYLLELTPDTNSDKKDRELLAEVKGIISKYSNN